MDARGPTLVWYTAVPAVETDWSFRERNRGVALRRHAYARPLFNTAVAMGTLPDGAAFTCAGRRKKRLGLGAARSRGIARANNKHQYTHGDPRDAMPTTQSVQHPRTGAPVLCNTKEYTAAVQRSVAQPRCGVQANDPAPAVRTPAFWPLLHTFVVPKLVSYNNEYIYMVVSASVPVSISVCIPSNTSCVQHVLRRLRSPPSHVPHVARWCCDIPM